MAALLTLLDDYKADFVEANDFNRTLYRQQNTGALDLFLSQNEGANALLSQKLKDSIYQTWRRNVKVPVMIQNDNVSVTDVLSCVIPDSSAETGMLQLTFAQLSFSVSLYPDTLDENMVDEAQYFNRMLEDRKKKFLATLNTMASDVLNTNKNTYWPSEITSIYPVVGDALQVTKSNEYDFYNQAGAIMNYIGYPGGPFNVLANTFHQPIVNRLINQGAANDENDAFQFGPWRFSYDNTLATPTGYSSTIYMVPDGQLGMATRVHPSARNRRRSGDGKIWGIDDTMFPGLSMGTYYYDGCADGSGIEGNTSLPQTYREAMQWHTQVAFATAFNPDTATRFNPIIKAEISRTDTLQSPPATV